MRKPVCIRRGRVEVTRGLQAPKRPLQSAFSLLELLCLMAILLILFVLYWKGFASRGSGPSQEAACMDNLQKNYLAMQIYANDNHGKFPDVPGARTSEEPLDLLVPRYTADSSLFRCPASKNLPPLTGQSLRANRISYACWAGRNSNEGHAPLLADELIDTLPKSTGQPAFSTTGKPPGSNHGDKGGNVLFGDGEVSWSAPAIGFPLPQSAGVTLLNPKQ